jgi:hypothetical protein
MDEHFYEDEPTEDAVAAWEYYEKHRIENDDQTNIETMETLISMIRRNTLK